MFVDGWERVATHAHGSLAGVLRTLLETSDLSGLRAVVTGGRAVLAGQLVPVFTQRLILRLGDPVDLAMAGIPAKGVPARQPPGRALDAATHHEVQVATVRGDLATTLGSTAQQWVGSGSPTRPAGWPRTVRRLPPSITFSSEGEPEGPTMVLQVGVRDGDLERVGFEPGSGDRRILVVGPPGSGRTTAVHTIAEALAASGYPLALVGARWRTLSRATLPTTHGDRAEVLVLTGYGDTDTDHLVEARRRDPTLAVFVDDVDRLAGLPIEPVLLEIARRVDDDRGIIVATVSTLALEGRIGAVATDLARARTGVVLWPAPGTSVLGIAVPDGIAPARIPGRGLLLRSGGVERIQVATVSRP